MAKNKLFNKILENKLLRLINLQYYHKNIKNCNKNGLKSMVINQNQIILNIMIN